jgi:hypothetical protein
VPSRRRPAIGGSKPLGSDWQGIPVSFKADLNFPEFIEEA